MPKDNKFFEDFSKMAGSAMDTAVTSMAQFKEQSEVWIKERFEHYSEKMQLVQREEFEVVKAMAEKARKENAALKKQLSELEQELKKKK